MSNKGGSPVKQKIREYQQGASKKQVKKINAYQKNEPKAGSGGLLPGSEIIIHISESS
ncbi:MAG: hypothetical protein M5U05_04805 [Anaerolineales bacterium]|nr:hypothetical protein [Anaerolineales bacterium]